MELESWQKLERLYQSALNVEESQRPGFIEAACGADEVLKQELRSLLAQSAPDSFLERPAMEAAAKEIAIAAAAGDSTAGDIHVAHLALRTAPAAIGRYRVVSLLGEGGMGTVYEAEQDQPRRTVALKVIKPGFATPETLRRFQHESQALGRLQHPGIAQIYEASTADAGFGPQPYFAMELIRGRALREYADGHHLGVRQRLELLARICDAVEHAHQRGVIHRDLKPGNILIDETGQPKILDFGVARVTESQAQLTAHTDLGELIGTLAYMSPEQVAGDPLALDTRSDVYALGVVLYELLAGKLPYDVDRKALPEAVEAIREADPPPLSSVDRRYRGDIDTIAAKALEKDKTRRYASAAALAGDIRRYLADEPITARPPSASYQVQKFARRHKALVVATAAVFLVLVAGVIASTWEAVRARAAERRADSAAATAQAVNAFLQNDLLAQASANKQAGPGTKPDPDLKVRTALDRAAARIEGKFDRQPEVEAAIRETMGQTYQDLGLYPEARKQLERALQLSRKTAGMENRKTLDIASRLGFTAYLEGKYPEAESLLTQTLAAQRGSVGREDPDSLASMRDLTTVYRGQGKYSEAEALDTQTLEVHRRVLGSEHPQTLTTMNNLAVDYALQGKYKQAEPLFTQIVQIRQRVSGSEHPQTLIAMNNLAGVYEELGKYPESEALHRQELDITRRTLGPEHPSTLISMTGLANTYDSEDKYADCEALNEQILEIRRRVQGPEHPDTLMCMNNLASVYGSEGKYVEAEALGRQVQQIDARVLGPEHPDTLMVMVNLAETLASEGKYDEADALFSRTAGIVLRVLGSDYPLMLDIDANRASMYQLQRKYALAETSAAKTLEAWRRTSGSDHPRTMGAALDLASAYQSQRKFTQSEPLAREAFNFYNRTQRDDWRRFRAESLLGASLAAQKKYSEAEPLLREGYRGMLARKNRIAVPLRFVVDDARASIVEFYTAWGKPEKAVEFQNVSRMGSAVRNSPTRR